MQQKIISYNKIFMQNNAYGDEKTMKSFHFLIS